MLLCLCGKKRRKCVPMIHPINALTPRVVFRGPELKNGKKSKGLSNSQIALANAGGVAALAGGVTTLVARAYTNSFAHAGVLGAFGALLTMFFMTPHLIDKIGLKKMARKTQPEIVAKKDFQKMTTTAKEYLIPAKKLVQFRSEPSINS